MKIHQKKQNKTKLNETLNLDTSPHKVSSKEIMFFAKYVQKSAHVICSTGAPD
jgi:hypothetical protein